MGGRAYEPLCVHTGCVRKCTPLSIHCEVHNGSQKTADAVYVKECVCGECKNIALCYPFGPIDTETNGPQIEVWICQHCLRRATAAIYIAECKDA